jgi:hypothetical protein
VQIRNIIIRFQVQTAIDKRTVDHQALIRVASARGACTMITGISSHFGSRLYRELEKRIARYYRLRLFRAIARLDLPTYEDPVVQRQLEATQVFGRSTAATNAIHAIIDLSGTVIESLAQVVVVYSVLREQPESALMVLVIFLSKIAPYFVRGGGSSHSFDGM